MSKKCFCTALISLFAFTIANFEIVAEDDLRNSIIKFENQTGWTVWFSLFYSQRNSDASTFQLLTEDPSNVHQVLRNRAIFYDRQIILTDSSGYSDVLAVSDTGESYLRGVRVLGVAAPIRRLRELPENRSYLHNICRSFEINYEPGRAMSKDDFLKLLQKKVFWNFDDKVRKWSLLNSDGERVSKNQYDDVKVFTTEIAPVKKESGWIYVDSSDQKVSEKKYDDADPFIDNVARVKLGDNWKNINRKFEIIEDCQR